MSRRIKTVGSVMKRLSTAKRELQYNSKIYIFDSIIANIDVDKASEELQSFYDFRVHCRLSSFQMNIMSTP